MTTNKKLISVVIPCFNEEKNIPIIFKRIENTLKAYRRKYNFEYVFTDNSSTDSTFQILEKIASAKKYVKVVRFSRNIGANRAIYFGLSWAKGSAAILIQADLQDPPELIPQFIKGWEKGFDVVYGVIKNRKEFVLLKKTRVLYYMLVSLLSDVEIPKNVGEFRIMSRRTLDAISMYKEDDIYLRGVIAHIGFPQKAIPYNRSARLRGRSSNNLFALVAYAMNGFLSTSVVPLRLALIVGFFFSMVGFLLTVYIVGARILFPTVAPKGFTTLGAILTFFSGVQLFAVGIIGEYIRKIYVQTLARPHGFVEKKLNM